VFLCHKRCIIHSKRNKGCRAAQLLEQEGVRAKFSVTIESKEVSKTFDQKMSQIIRQVNVPGFRPGKAPKGMVLKRIGGEEVLQQEVREALVDYYYPRALKELELNAVHISNLDAENPSSKEDYSFTLDVELYPETKLADSSEIIIDTDREMLSDEAVEESVLGLRNEHAIQTPVDRASEANDVLMVAFEDSDDNIFPMDLGQAGEKMRDQMIGKNIGDVVELDLAQTLVDDAEAEADEIEEDSDALEAAAQADAMTESADEGIAEAAADSEAEASAEEATTDDATTDEEADVAEADDVMKPFKLVIKDIKEKELPELDDDFAESLGLKTWDEVETNIRANMQNELDRKSFDAQLDEFVEKLVESSEVELPDSFVIQQKQHLLKDLENNLKQQGSTLNSFMQNLAEDEEEQKKFNDELDQQATFNVKRDLVLDAMLEARGTTMSDSEFEQSINYLAYSEQTTVKKLKKDRGPDWFSNYRYLLTRQRALRDALDEIVGDMYPQPEPEEEVSADNAEASDAEAVADIPAADNLVRDGTAEV